jgi:hypothetical protein
VKRKFIWWLVAVVIMLICSCSKKQVTQAPAPQQNMDPVDRSVESHLEPQNVLHRTFPIRDHAEFAFSVPPRQKDAKLLGSFRSFTKRGTPDSTNNGTANVDLMVLNDQQLDDFLHGRPVSAAYEADPSNNERAQWKVPPTYDQPQTYHLVFSNAASGPKTRFVEADFTVTFQ